MKSDKDFVLKAIGKNGESIRYVSDELKSAKDFVLKAIEKNGESLIYMPEELKSDKDFIEDYYDSIRSTLIGEHDFVIKGNNSPIKWNEPDRYSKNEAVRFLSIILELQAMDKRLINRSFKSWIKKTFKKHVSKEFFESLNDQPTKDGELIE